MTDRPIHWSAVVADRNPPTRPYMAAFFAAMALAHSRAYGAAIGGGTRDREKLRDAVDRHYHPMFAAFTAAAALHGWDPDRIDAAIEGGVDVDEWAWQWLRGEGVAASVIERLTWSLNTPDVITEHEGATTP